MCIRWVLPRPHFIWPRSTASTALMPLPPVLIHDWDKVLSDDELVTRALHYGIKIAGSPSAATPLLHGPVAAYELPQLFPELSPAVFQAVDRHTVGACDMTPLDMVVFVADAIEPNRHGDYAHALRKMVGESSLDELFFSCFAQGLVYVIQSGRYLYPTAIIDLQPLRPAALARAV